jgi:type IV secretion system protein VirB8
MNAIHQARPLTDGEQQTAYEDALSFYGAKHRMNRLFNRLGWWVGGIGMVSAAASAVGWCILLPLKSTQVQFVEVDHTTGIIAYGAGPADAPALFGQREAEHYLMQYVEAREGYVPEVDERKWNIVLEMSSDDVATEYNAWRKSDLSPVKMLGTVGHVTVSDFTFTPHGKGKTETYEYTVRYKRQEVRGNDIGPKKPWSVTVDFQWHPKASMTVQEGHDNPGGMVVVAYTPPAGD